MATNGKAAARQAAARVSRLAALLGSMALGWAALYLVVFLLFSLAAIVRLSRPLPAGVSIEPLEVASSDHVEVHGSTKPLALVEVGVNDRSQSIEPADSAGNFQAVVVLSPGAERVWARTFDHDGAELGRAETPVKWRPGAFPIHVDLCLASPRQGLLWVAGRAGAGEPLDSQPPVPSTVSLQADGHGIVDLLFPFADPAPQQIVLSARGSTQRRSAPAPCRLLAADETLPLVRHSTIVERGDFTAALAELQDTGGRARRRALLSLLAKVLPRAQFVVRLPALHPYYQALTAGQLSPAEFVDATVGELDGLPDARMIESLRSDAGPDGDLPAELATQTQVWRDGDSARVEVKTPLFAMLSGSGEMNLRPSWHGIARQPLLSAEDRLEIHPVRGDRWAYDPSPDVMAPAAVAWLGPRKDAAIAATRALPVELVNALRFADRAREKARPANMREFLRTIDRPTVWSPGIVVWKGLLELVPAAAVAWLLRRRGAYASAPGAPRLGALTLVVAAALASPPLVSLLQPGLLRLPFPAFERALSAVASSFEFAPPIAAEFERLHALGQAAPWLMLTVLAGSIPLFFGDLSRALRRQTDEERPPRRRRRRWRLFLTLPVALFSALVLGLVWDATSEAPRLLAAGDWRQQLHGLASVLERFPAPALPLLLMATLFVCAGLRGLLFAGGYLAAAWLVFAPTGDVVAGALGRGVGTVALASGGLAAIPLTARLLSVAVPVGWARRSRWLVALAASAACLVLPAVPTRLVLGGAAGLIGMGLIWAAAACFGGFAPARALGDWIESHPRQAALAFLAAGVGLGWPMAGPVEPLQLWDLASLVDHWTTLLPYLLGVALCLLVVAHLTASGRHLLTGGELAAGMALYTAFLVSPTTTWLLVPVPLLVALAMARHWLFVPPAGDWPAPTVPTDALAEWRDRLKGLLDGERRRGRAEAAIRALDKELEGAKLSPSAYERRRRPYEEMAATAQSASAEGARFAFAVGDPRFSEGVGAFLGTGLLIASAPILISLYEYLPQRGVNYPFPVADFLAFLFAAILKWGLYAAFFGIFFANLRGETGLTKGLHLFLAVAAPFAVYRLLGGPSAEELRPFLFWLAQLFVFFGGLGLLAGDLRLLHNAGGRAADLRTVHRLPALYGFLSTAAAAILPAVLAAVAGKLGDVVKFFMQLVVPGGTGSP